MKMMNDSGRFSAVIVAILALSFGCETPQIGEPSPTISSGVYILNEGAFRASNAELSYLDLSTGRVSGSVFSKANPGYILGDVANSITVIDGQCYVAVNNSRKVEIVSAGTHVRAGTIFLQGLPRVFHHFSNTKGYVTNQDSTVSVVDLVSRTEVKRLTVGLFPEGMVQSGDRLLVLNGGFGFGSTISVVNTSTDVVERTLQTPAGPAYGKELPGGTIIVLCTGYTDYVNSANSQRGCLIVLDPTTLAAMDTTWFDGVAGKMAVDAERNVYTTILRPTGAYVVSKVATVGGLRILSSDLVGGKGGIHYGIGLHQGLRELYIADAGNFVGNGSVTVFTLQGLEIRRFEEGIGVAPNGFAFP